MGDCCAVRFILSYYGNNPALLRLQMRPMCWDIDIIHQNNTHLTNAVYWSRLGKDICSDLHFCDYLQFDRSLRADFPTLTALPPMLPQNMPYYCGLQIPSQADCSVQDTNGTYCQTLLSTIIGSDGTGHTHLSHIPVWFGDFNILTPADAHASTNHKIPYIAQQILRFRWAVYYFGGGCFASTISSHNLPFCVKMECNQYKSGSALFCEFMPCTGIFNSRNKMLHYICASVDNSQIHGYLIHSIQFLDSDTTATFWQLQGTIVA